MKHLLVGIVLMGFVAASLTALAEEKAATPAIPAAEKAVKEKPAVALPEITVTGKISKEEKKVEGKTEAKVKYVLTTAEGVKIHLPETKAEVADLEKFVGKDVKVVGKGKDDKATKKIHLKSIVSVEEVPAPATK